MRYEGVVLARCPRRARSVVLTLQRAAQTRTIDCARTTRTTRRLTLERCADTRDKAQGDATGRLPSRRVPGLGGYRGTPWSAAPELGEKLWARCARPIGTQPQDSALLVLGGAKASKTSLHVVQIVELRGVLADEFGHVPLARSRCQNCHYRGRHGRILTQRIEAAQESTRRRAGEYGCLRTYPRSFARKKAVPCWQKTWDEEGAAFQAITDLSEELNAEADEVDDA